MVLAAVCFVWAGMVLGISFLETPIKFTAPSVTLPIGLDVGRHVFGMFNKVEIFFALLVCGLMILSRPSRSLWLLLGAVCFVVALQSVWLLPVLDARVQTILSGKTPPAAPYHIIYVVSEMLKLISLMAAGIASLRALQSSVQREHIFPEGDVVAVGPKRRKVMLQ